MSKTQLEAPKGTAIESDNSTDTKLSGEANDLLRNELPANEPQTDQDFDVNEKFGSPEIDFGDEVKRLLNEDKDGPNTLTGENATEGIADGEKPVGEGHDDSHVFKEKAESLSPEETESTTDRSKEIFEPGEVNSMAELSESVDPVQEGLDLAKDYFPGESDEEVAKRNGAFMALMKMQGEPGFEDVDLSKATGNFNGEDLISFSKMANEAGVLDSAGSSGATVNTFKASPPDTPVGEDGPKLD